MLNVLTTAQLYKIKKHLYIKTIFYIFVFQSNFNKPKKNYAIAMNISAGVALCEAYPESQHKNIANTMKLPVLPFIIAAILFAWQPCGAQNPEITRWAMFPNPEKYMDKYGSDTPSKDIFMDKMESLINTSVFYPLEQWMNREEDISYVTITVLKDGSVSGKIAKDSLNPFDMAAKRLIENLPEKMIPAEDKDGNPVSIVFNQPVVFSRTGNIKPAERLFIMFEGGEKYMFDRDKLLKYNGQVLNKYLVKAFASERYKKYVRQGAGKIYVRICVYADGKVEYSLLKQTKYADLNEKILEILHDYPGKIIPARYPDGETFTQAAIMPINFPY